MRQGCNQLSQFSFANITEFAMLNQGVTLGFHSLHIGFLSVKRLLSHILEVLLVSGIDIETVTHRSPFGFVYELLRCAIALFFIRYHTIVNIEIV